MTLDFAGTATPLLASDVKDAALRLACEPAAVWAVTDVESSGGGFLPDKRPKILYEAHVFGRLTGHKFDKSHPAISAPHWDRALYGAPGAHQYERLAEAIRLDRAAALESASWGMFQVLGLNHGQCGYATVGAFVSAMAQSEAKQLLAFCEFCRHGGLDRFLRSKDWVRFALGYNGPGERSNHYDERLKAAYLARTARRVAVIGHADQPHLIGANPQGSP